MKTLQAILIVMFLGLTLTSYAQERGHSFSPNYQGYYYLRTAFTGDQFSLESNDPTSSYMNGAVFMTDEQGVTGTMWKFVPDNQNKGWYRLKSAFQGDRKCLECNGSSSDVKNGAAFMDDCKNVSGQLWRLELVSSANGDHLYRLRSMLHGNDASLEGNRSNGDAEAGNSFMDATQDVSGQYWRLVPVK